MKRQEKKRIQALRELDILGAEGGSKFDNLAVIATHLYNTPIAQINFIDEKNQWSLSSCGMKGDTVPRETSFCNKTIAQDRCLIIEDACKHEDFRNNVFVTDEPHIRFYAGVNIKSGDGYNIGTICVIDQERRKMKNEQLEPLFHLARQVEHQLELRKKNQQPERQALYLKSTVDVQILADSFQGKIEELVIGGDRQNGQGFGNTKITLYDLFPRSKTRGYLHDWIESSGPDAHPFRSETPLRLPGQSRRWYEVTGIYQYGKIFLTARDIEVRKSYESQLDTQRRLSNTIIESLPGLFAVFNQHGRLVRWNENLQTVMSRNRDELEGEHFSRLVEHNPYRLARSLVELNLECDTVVELSIPTVGTSRKYHFVFRKEWFNDSENYVGIGMDITDKVVYENQLEAALAEKEALLAEVHHRVKNNLAVVSGMLELEAGNYEDKLIQQVFEKSQLRIQSIAKIHETLYSAERLNAVPLDEYLRDLIQTIEEMFKGENGIDIDFHCDPVRLNINQAIPLALIVNELVINSFQHGFENKEEGQIWIQIKKKGELLKVDVSDSGKGLPEELDINAPTSLGMTLVNTLTKQLNGKMEVIDRSDSHLRFEFYIKDQRGAHAHSFFNKR